MELAGSYKDLRTSLANAQFYRNDTTRARGSAGGGCDANGRRFPPKVGAQAHIAPNRPKEYNPRVCLPIFRSLNAGVIRGLLAPRLLGLLGRRVIVFETQIQTTSVKD
jgi:hypothetical protein